jgi:DNA-directed RNA polymerase specialized sigma24 family protein
VTEEQVAEEGMALIRQGKVEEGASLMVRKLSKRLQRYYERHGVPPAQAEELVSDAWLKLVNSQFRGETRAIVWVWKIAGSVLLDWVERNAAARRAGSADQPAAEVQVDDEAWSFIAESAAAPQAPAWLSLCIERAAFLFEREEPRRAEVLRFSCEGWSAEEIAAYYGAPPHPSEKQKTAARNRVLDAVKRARGYFAHCKETP